jgi:WD40 repeat protein
MVNCAVLSPNQVEIIFGDQSGRIRIWDLTNNSCRDLKDSDDLAIRSLAINSDASRLVAGNSSGDVYVCTSTNAGEDFILT